MNSIAYMNIRNDYVWLACGENCMPIDILRRNRLNSPSTPFSSCRSTIEHIHYHETNEYQNYLRQDFLVEANGFSERCYLNLANRSSKFFNPGRHRYLELTHHNPLENEARKTLRRRIKRMIEARSKSEMHIFLYHHRSVQGFKKQAKEQLKVKFESILRRYKNARALCYSQEIVKEKQERSIEIKETTKGALHFCTLKNLKSWAGNDLDQFFGKNDEDLFKRMFKAYDRRIKELQE